MNFLEEAGNLEGEDDLEILEVTPMKAIAPIPPVSKGKGESIVPAKRKGGGEKVMVEAQRTRASKRLAKGEMNVAREVKAESLMSVGTGRRWNPEWQLSEETMLLTPDEREEWAGKVLPPGAKNRVRMRPDGEKRDKVNSAVIEVLGAISQMREDLSTMTHSKKKMEEVVKHYSEKYKEANEVLKVRNEEKNTWMEDKEKLEKANNALEGQVQELIQEKEDLEGRVDRMEGVREFWMERGAGKIVGTCLKSPELYQWLLRFGETILNIGKAQGAAAVFAKYTEDVEYWSGKSVEEVPGCTRGLRYPATYIDDKIRMLQEGRIKFQFLEYLAANPGIDQHELENLGYYAYKNLADGAVASSSTAIQAPIEGLDFEDKGVEELMPVEAPVGKEPEVEEAGKEPEEAREEETEKEAEGEGGVEGLGNAGEK